MSRRLLPLLLLACVALTLLVAAPTWAQESEPAGSEPASEPAGTESPTSDLPDPGEGDEEEGGSGKIKLPLDLEDRQDLLGLVLLAVVAAAAGLALMGAVKQLRGERSQADGTWRPR